MEKNPEITLNVYDRLRNKLSGEDSDLDYEEREALEDILMDDYSEWVTRISHEEILTEAKDRGAL